MKKDIKKLLNGIYKGANTLEEVEVKDLVSATLEWFKYYQGNQDANEMKELYSKLINEEGQEMLNSWYDKDIIELLDGLIDLIWVEMGYQYFYYKAEGEEKPEDNERIVSVILSNIVIRTQYILIPVDLFKLAYLEIAYSNWTKSLELRDDTDEEGKVGKVIKGKDFKKPNLKKVFKFFKDNNKSIE